MLPQPTSTHHGDIPLQTAASPTIVIISLLSDLSSEIQKYINAEPDFTSLINSHRGIYRELRVAIKRTSPRFVPLVDADGEKPELLAVCLIWDDQEDNGADVLGLKPIYLKDVRIHIAK
jgi:hypothetical protein